MRGSMEARELQGGTWMAVCTGLSGKASVDGRTWEPAFPQSSGASYSGRGLNMCSGVCTLILCQAWASCHLWAAHGACQQEVSSHLSGPFCVGHWGLRCTQPHHGLYRAGYEPKKRVNQLPWFVMKQGVISGIGRSRELRASPNT